MDACMDAHVQLDKSLVGCTYSWAIELNTRREIPYLHAPMYYFLMFITIIIIIIIIIIITKEHVLFVDYQAYK